jgi:hypothetical protein
MRLRTKAPPFRFRNMPPPEGRLHTVYNAWPEHAATGTRRAHIVLLFQRAVSVLIRDANVTDAENPLTGISTWRLADFTAHKM